MAAFKKSLLLLLAFLNFDLLIVCAETVPDPLWIRAKKVLDDNKNFVAGTIATDMEMLEGNGKSMGSLHINEMISGWENGEPIRKIVTISNPDHNDVAKGRFKVVVDNHPDQALKDGTTLTRLETSTLEGKACVIFQVAGLTPLFSIKTIG